MKLIDIHGKPIVNNHQALDRQIKDEGLDGIDLDELYFLDDTCYDDDEDWWPVFEPFAVEEPDRLSCYDDDEGY